MRDGDEPPGETYNYEKPKSDFRKKNKKRFTDDQIKSLESIFKVESRLDPRKKMQVARELDLQPRQVSIWFQNRRARWKSKHLEADYATLKSKFDCLSLQFESLKEQKEFLLKELESLHNLMSNENREGKDIADDVNNNCPAHGTYSSDHLEIKSFKSLDSSKEWDNLDFGSLFNQTDTSPWLNYCPV